LRACHGPDIRPEQEGEGKTNGEIKTEFDERQGIGRADDSSEVGYSWVAVSRIFGG